MTKQKQYFGVFLCYPSQLVLNFDSFESARDYCYDLNKKWSSSDPDSDSWKILPTNSRGEPCVVNPDEIPF